MYDACIIGGGASGLTAAIALKKSGGDPSVIILEKKHEPARKLLATGNGKCNLSNENCPGYKETLAFFQTIGLLTREDEAGRFYPYTEDAADVVEALLRRNKSAGIEIRCDAQVSAVTHEAGVFHVTYGTKGSLRTIDCRKLLIAGGGKAGPAFGTTGDAYKLAESLGHRVTKLAPALTAVETYDDMTAFAGIRAKARVMLKYKGEEVFEEAGEVQFTRYGISGICVFDLSRFLILPEGKNLKGGFDDYEILVDFFPKGGDIENFLRQRAHMKDLAGENILDSLVRQPIGRAIYEKSGGDVKAMAELLRGWPLRPKGLKGWDFAQITRGGVPLAQVDEETMESKIVKDLYFAGEVLDYDGPCGGFNLQNAWETGIRAGRGMSR